MARWPKGSTQSPALPWVDPILKFPGPHVGDFPPLLQPGTHVQTGTKYQERRRLHKVSGRLCDRTFSASAPC